jgi:hypothetical protein
MHLLRWSSVIDEVAVVKRESKTLDLANKRDRGVHIATDRTEMRLDSVLNAEATAYCGSPPCLFERKLPVLLPWDTFVKHAGKTRQVIAVQRPGECDRGLKDFAIPSSHGTIKIICRRLRRIHSDLKKNVGGAEPVALQVCSRS